MDIITRAEWGAREPRSITKFTASQLPTPGLILHHAGRSGGGAARVRSIQDFHMDSRGWRDIAYHYLIDADGSIYEGRSFGIVGGATFGQNEVSHALCLLGNFNYETPTDAAINSLVGMIRMGNDQGFTPRGLTGGHRDFRSTSCPGANLYPLIPTINELAKGDEMSLTPIEEKVVKDIVASVLDRESNGGFAGLAIDLIRKERQMPLHKPESGSGGGLERGDTVTLV